MISHTLNTLDQDTPLMCALISDDLTTLLALFDSESIQPLAAMHPDFNALLQELTAQEQYEHAINLLAHALKMPFASVWGYFCLGHAHLDWQESELTAMNSIRQWLDEPNDENRRLHENVLQTVGIQSPAGWLSQAVFWSGGSISPPEAPDVSPQPFLFGHALAGALQLAALSDDGRHSATLYPLFVKTGLRLAKGMPKEQLLKINYEDSNP